MKLQSFHIPFLIGQRYLFMLPYQSLSFCNHANFDLFPIKCHDLFRSNEKHNDDSKRKSRRILIILLPLCCGLTLAIVSMSLYGIIYALTQASCRTGIDKTKLLKILEICSRNLRNNRFELYLDKKEDRGFIHIVNFSRMSILSVDFLRGFFR